MVEVSPDANLSRCGNAYQLVNTYLSPSYGYGSQYVNCVITGFESATWQLSAYCKQVGMGLVMGFGR